MLNGATGSIFYYKINAELYVLSGYVSTTTDKWFANFPVVPSSIYKESSAKIIGVNSAGDVVAININASRGMTVPAVGSYWITGIVVSA